MSKRVSIIELCPTLESFERLWATVQAANPTLKRKQRNVAAYVLSHITLRPIPDLDNLDVYDLADYYNVPKYEYLDLDIHISRGTWFEQPGTKYKGREPKQALQSRTYSI
ncbi:MAG: hypothetical protein CL489_06370 [Acidobacteria bacterium]|nr:hypothetical protein [Acidobacteriota bacterium]|tara:strand:- start:50015 stop:50344 length:330 start_codon:yes stop_codon:yes gene_type:complete